jgi:hypothetical protein
VKRTTRKVDLLELRKMVLDNKAVEFSMIPSNLLETSILTRHFMNQKYIVCSIKQLNYHIAYFTRKHCNDFKGNGIYFYIEEDEE